MWCAWHKPCPLLREEIVLAVSWSTHVCTSLTPRPMTVVFGLETRLHVRMRRRLENSILHNGHQLRSAVNNFIMCLSTRVLI